MSKSNKIKISILFSFIFLNSCGCKRNNLCEEDIYKVNDTVYISPYKSSKVHKGYIINITQDGYLVRYKDKNGDIKERYYSCYKLNKFD